MSERTTSSRGAVSVSREFQLPVDQIERLSGLAAARSMSESDVLERALDIFFGLADVFGDDLDRPSLYRMSEPSLMRIWDNDRDAVYDDWRNLYGVQEG